MDPDAEFADDWDIVRGDTDAAEFEKLKRFREALRDKDDHPACRHSPLTSDPYTLLRQLRSQALDVDSAARWYKDVYLEWRTQINYDDRMAAWREEYAAGQSRRAVVMRDYCPVKEICPDKYGVPMLLVRVGVLDTTGVVREAGDEAILMFWLSFMERGSEHLIQASRRLRKVVPGQVWIGDFGNTPYVPDWTSRMTLGGKGVVDVLKTYKYPVTMRKVLIIRTGLVVQNLWKVVFYPVFRTVCSKTSLANVHVRGSYPSSWRASLLSEMGDALNTLPEFLVSDDTVACEAAEPVGGLVPATRIPGVLDDSRSGHDAAFTGGEAVTELSNGVSQPATTAELTAASEDLRPVQDGRDVRVEGADDVAAGITFECYSDMFLQQKAVAILHMCNLREDSDCVKSDELLAVDTAIKQMHETWQQAQAQMNAVCGQAMWTHQVAEWERQLASLRKDFASIQDALACAAARVPSSCLASPHGMVDSAESTQADSHGTGQGQLGDRSQQRETLLRPQDGMSTVDGGLPGSRRVLGQAFSHAQRNLTAVLIILLMLVVVLACSVAGIPYVYAPVVALAVAILGIFAFFLRKYLKRRQGIQDVHAEV